VAGWTWIHSTSCIVWPTFWIK